MKNNMNITLFLLVASIVLAVIDAFIERETILWVFYIIMFGVSIKQITESEKKED